MSEALDALQHIDGMLLMELVEALQARGALKREDIAGALLRTEVRARMADEIDSEEDGITTTSHAGACELAMSEWDRRFALKPELYTLRKAQQEWEAGGAHGKSPLYPELVVALFQE